MFETKPDRAVCTAVLPLLILAGCGGDSASPPPEPKKCLTCDQQTEPPAGMQVCTAKDALPPQLTAAEMTVAPPAGTAPAAAAPKRAALTDAELDAIQNEKITLAANTTPIAQIVTKTPDWPVWWGVGGGKAVDGVNCLLSGAWHKHAMISIYVDGRRAAFPDGVGRVHAGCYHAYEMHVHDTTGIIHMEADTPRQFKLGQWFSLWQQPLSRDNVGGFVGPVRFYIIENNTVTRYDGDPRDIDMLPHREVLIVSGKALSVVPRYVWPLGV
jgi:hypothetical protein